MAGRSVCKKDCLGTKSSRPARRRDGDANASRGLGREPQWESRGQSPLVLSAEDAAPARGGSPEGKALWCCPQRTSPRVRFLSRGIWEWGDRSCGWTIQPLKQCISGRPMCADNLKLHHALHSRLLLRNKPKGSLCRPVISTPNPLQSPGLRSPLP